MHQENQRDARARSRSAARTSGRRLAGRAAGTLLVLGCLVLAGARAQEDRQPEPIRTDVQEKVTVRLVDVEILVTDKAGDAIRDLRKDEIEVREGGRVRKVAFLESMATSDLAARLTEEPAPLFRQAGAPPEPEGEQPPSEIVIPAPPPQRRMVLLFDAFNSRTPDRGRWIDAARGWVEEEMRPDDRVALAVMERAEVNLVVPFTSDRQLLLGHLASDSIVGKERYHDYMIDIRTLLDDLQTCVSAYEPTICAMTGAQTYLHEWRVRSQQTLLALKGFAASLAAIPGRKAVLYLSDGIVVNPGEMATQAIVATLGMDEVPYNLVSAELQQDLYYDAIRALRVASTADVTFFTFDTRHSSMRDVSWTAEERVALHERRMSDPFALMFDATRGSLDTVAVETGGRSYHGPSIEKNLPRAIRAIEGLYTVSYYRDAAETGDPKIKVNVARKGAVVTYPRKAVLDRQLPVTARLELGLANPRPHLDGLLVPLVIQLPVERLDFSREEGLLTAGVALYAEAIRVTGERAADVFEMVAVTLPDKADRESLRGQRLVHTLALVVPPGAYRFRVRVCDSAFSQAAERSVDATILEDGSLVAGIQETGSIQESGQIPAETPPR